MMRNYDGSSRSEAVEAELRRNGYVQRFACMTSGGVPDDLPWTGRETGWEMRRRITAWCASHGIDDFRILRNTSYHHDLHGVVYELYVRVPRPCA